MSSPRLPVASAVSSAWLLAVPLYASPNNFSEFRIPDPKVAVSRAAVPAIRTCLDGDDFARALPILELPCDESGTTCGFHDDVAAPCTFVGGGPDVVYVHTPAADVTVDVDLCDTGYDNALHVYAGAALEPVACSDDACDRGARIAGLRLSGGVPYYFVIDGWNGDCGSYALQIRTEPLSCAIEPPSAIVLEGEPDCAPDVYDAYNRGCNDFPYCFTPLPGVDSVLVVAGTYGTFPYFQEEFRDTDWYSVEFAEPAVLECSVVGGATTQLAILDGRAGCEDWGEVCGHAIGPACELIRCAADVQPGTYWVFVATRWFSGVRCGTPYLLTLRRSPGPTVTIRSRSWTAIKNLYR